MRTIPDVLTRASIKQFATVGRGYLRSRVLDLVTSGRKGKVVNSKRTESVI